MEKQLGSMTDRLDESLATHRVVSQEEWIKARKDLLKKEKELTRLNDELSRQRRELPWVKVDKSYMFEGTEGKLWLSDLFYGKSQLIVYHFMFAPEWEEGCPGCSFLGPYRRRQSPFETSRCVGGSRFACTARKATGV